jgi:hypothetical protein
MGGANGVSAQMHQSASATSLLRDCCPKAVANLVLGIYLCSSASRTNLDSCLFAAMTIYRVYQQKKRSKHFLPFSLYDPSKETGDV